MRPGPCLMNMSVETIPCSPPFLGMDFIRSRPLSPPDVPSQRSRDMLNTILPDESVHGSHRVKNTPGR